MQINKDVIYAEKLFNLNYTKIHHYPLNGYDISDFTLISQIKQKVIIN